MTGVQTCALPISYRLDILKQHGLGLNEIQAVIAEMEPLPGAREFVDELRSFSELILVSDTFYEFALPLVEKLGKPTIFCNALKVAEDGEILGLDLRGDNKKITTIKALQSIGFTTIASGDSHNDIGMIQQSKAGALFKANDALKKQYPEIPAFDEYDDLLAFIKKNMD